MAEIKIKCATCGQEFLRKSSEVTRNKKLNRKNYCSRKCIGESLNRRVLAECASCGVEIMVEPRAIESSKSGNVFCSRSCSAKVNLNRKGTGAEKNLVCLFCGSPNHRGVKYCSNKCFSEHRHSEYISAWLSGDVSGNCADGSVSSHVRRYFFDKYLSRCVKCGWSKVNPTTGKIPLVMNHIDGNSENTVIGNLELICPSCDSLTSTYCSLNIGNGRKKRREKLRIDRKNCR